MGERRGRRSPRPRADGESACVRREDGNYVSRLGAALARRIHFFAFLTSWQETMVEHFVSHYTSLGIDLVARSNLTLHAVGGAMADAERRCAHFLRAKGHLEGVGV